MSKTPEVPAQEPSLDELLANMSQPSPTPAYDVTYCGMVAIVGRPNVGKSTLLNRLLGQKVSITSRKPQTTRHRIMGIHTEGPSQIVFIDTPGLHIEEKRAINRLMNRAAASSLADVCMVIFVVDGLNWTADDEMVLNKLRHGGNERKTVLAVNKVDYIKDKETLFPHLEALGQKYAFDEIVPISAKSGTNVGRLMSLAKESLPESVHYFPEDYITDRSQRFMASEIVREKLMRFLGDELPYDATVEIEQFKMMENGVYQINALILVERDGQKRMVIGKKGERIRTIATEARKDMEQLFDNKVFLEVWVKVKSGWADDERALRSLGYGED
ncbi:MULTISPECIES: GTPase Era [Shewanella]|jgi:GTP-binding protein Era|uniref:GTPase Era n=1 Tax=Shewanella chilikensis TaxID=558541 RepID=A0A6G7LQ21_9GAMM|nr:MULTISPECIES: GTPase Era [Shewanella]MBZ4678491.1 GTPase Era [Shewanella sp.]MCA0951082.1 GTPase Era [Shewanella chilikensis]MCE9854052.1 GTPase Era [Shewanella chilikensis]MCL1152441.1 GTPase Era [Shewanella chilikensis]PYE59233.1 GTP-binding protein Era [Shewanella chilikensis]